MARSLSSSSPRAHVPSPRRALPALAGLLAAATLLPAQSGTWAPVSAPAPGTITVMLLLPDATVMCAAGTPGNSWYRLTPNALGSYQGGTWTALAPMNYTRLYFQTQVLQDGRVFVSGGEYGTGGPRAEVYNPQTNTWTVVAPPASLWNPASDNFYDCNSEILPDGSVLLMPVFPHTGSVGLIYHPNTNTWNNAGPLAHGFYQDEATWVKLADDTILTIDPFGTQTERYHPTTNTWIADSNVPVTLYDSFLSEIGPGMLLPNGKAFFIGSTGHTALYTPGIGGGAGSWVAGPDVPGGRGAPDAPCAMLVNGRVLCAVSPAPTSASFPPPTTFVEYDPLTNSFANVNAPSGGGWNEACFTSNFLDLPDGTVLHSHFSSQLYVYTPAGSPITGGNPVITQIRQHGDGSFRLTGTGLTGMSEGAIYGDDWQMNSNYPIVRLHLGALVYRARTYNWSSTSVQTGAQVQTTEFVLPLGMPAGTYQLEVSANGHQSAPVAFTVPYPSWNNLGNGLAGTNGVPSLTAVGNVYGDDTTNFLFTQCLPSTLGICVFGTSAVNVPLWGGLLVPSNDALAVFLPNAFGSATLPVHWFAGLTAGLPVYAQGWIWDAAGPQGFSASNAISTTSL